MSRNVDIALRLHYSQFYTGMRRAAYETRKFGHDLDTANMRSQASMQTLGRAGMLAGGLMLAGMGLAVRAAMNFETAWTGVRKTVEGTEPQLNRLRQGIRDMAKEIPASTTEIAAVAEEAGQLGIATPDILGFTRVMVDMGNTTNLSATEAAESMARLANITQMPQDEFDRLGSTVVDLGNKFATTEAEIAHMSVRIAGAGHLVGMSEADILGFSSALSSVGVYAEAGGSAISRVFIEIHNAVGSGGDELEKFAEVAGMSAETFSQQWGTKPAQAALAFIEGLQRMRSEGINLFPVLEDLSMNNIRVRDSVLRLVGAGDLLRRNLETAKTAWSENTALTTEAERRYATTASQMEIARNNAEDLAISLGSVLLPAVGSVARGFTGFMHVLEGVPTPVIQFVAIGTTLVGGLMLVGGALTYLAPMWSTFIGAMETATLTAMYTGGAITGTAGSLTTLATTAKAAGSAMISTKGQMLGVGVLMVGVTQAFQESSSAAADMRAEMSNKVDTSSFEAWGQGVQDMRDRIEEIKQQQRNENPFSSLARTVGDMVIPFHNFDNTALDATQSIRGLNAEIAEQNRRMEITNRHVQALTVNFGLNEEQVLAIADAYDIDLSGDDFVAISHDVGVATNAIRNGTPATDQLTTAMTGMADETSNATDRMDSFTEAVAAFTDFTMAAFDAETAFARGIADLGSALEENGADMSTFTQEGLDNRDAFSQAARAARDYALAVAKDTGDIGMANYVLADHVNQLTNVMRQAGFSEEAIAGLIDEMGLTPENLYTLIALQDPNNAQGQLDALQTQLGVVDGMDPQIDVSFNIDDQMLAALQYALEGTYAGGPDAPFSQDQIDALDEYINGQQGNKSNRVTIEVDADTTKASKALVEIGKKSMSYASMDFTSTVDAMNEKAKHKIKDATTTGKRWANSTFVSTVDADRRPASASITGARGEAEGRWGGKTFSAVLSAQAGGSIGDAVGRALSQITSGLGFGDGEGITGPMAESIKQGMKEQRGVGGTGYGYYAMANAAMQQGGSIGPVDYSDGTVDEIIGYANRVIPGRYSISSTFRKGAITSTGNASYHGKNRAVDFGGDLWTVFKAFRRVGRSLKELIFTPAGGDQIKNGSPHVYTGGTIQKDHYDHVHVALERGGVMGQERNRGMVVDHPTVLVGEGRPGFPEYVIPTDPSYRGRAMGLFSDLAVALGRPFEHAHLQGLKMGGIVGSGPRIATSTTVINIGTLSISAPNRSEARSSAKAVVKELNRMASENS